MDNHIIALTINSNRKSSKQKHLNKYMKAVERILKRKKSNDLIR